MKATDKKNKLPQESPKENTDRREERIDAELDQSFPASDPPSYSKPGNDYKRTTKH